MLIQICDSIWLHKSTMSWVDTYLKKKKKLVISILHIFIISIFFTAYIQGVGRAGRDGEPAVARLYYNSTDIAPSLEHLQRQMRDYCKLPSCRRNHILEYFGHNGSQISGHHTCCDICSENCHCGHCRPCEDASAGKSSPHVLYTPIQITSVAKEMLSQYFKAENAILSDQLVPEAFSGLSTQLANHLATEALKFVNKVELDASYPHLKDCYKDNIILILNSAAEAADTNVWGDVSIMTLNWFGNRLKHRCNCGCYGVRFRAYMLSWQIDNPISLIPQCIRQMSHNASFVTEMCTHLCTFLLQNDALWDMGLVHCGICATGLLQWKLQLPSPKGWHETV